MPEKEENKICNYILFEPFINDIKYTPDYDYTSKP